MATRTRKRPVRRTPSTDDLDTKVSDYLLARSLNERTAFVTAKSKAEFMELLAAVGELEEGGHRVLLLNEPLLFHSYTSGKAKEKEVLGIRSVRREQKSLNEERAMAFLRKKGLLDRCTSQITVINEDAILAANFDETISDADLDSLYDESETHAFYLVERK